jgi:CRISPR system Cascade subunit CasC
MLTEDERKDVVRTFIESTLLAMPGARKNSMNAYTRPGYVLGIVRERGHPIQLINAFENPVRPFGGKSLFECSLDALKKEHDTLNETWALESLASVAMPELNLNSFLDELVSHVD